MRHLSDGMLRRLHDEPLAIPARAREHCVSCTGCRGRYSAIGEQARTCAELFAMVDTPVDPGRALAQLRERIVADDGVTRPRVRGGPLLGLEPGRRRVLAAVGGLVAAAVLIASLALTPAGSLAESLITVFEPKAFVAVPVTGTDLQSLRDLPDLQAFGSVHVPASLRPQRVEGPVAAAAASGLTVRTPSWLPPGVPTTVTYRVLARNTASFTFSAAKATAAIARGQSLPQLPANLDGSELEVVAGPAVVATYGGTTGKVAGNGVDSGSPASGLPTLVIAQARMPRVSATGASVATIEGYLLRLPGVTPHLAQEIRAIGNPESTLPIPIPLDYASAQTVLVHGIKGLAIGDETGLGSGVIWQEGGKVYGVAGTLPESQIVAIADAMR